jgi:hypothetical protein
MQQRASTYVGGASWAIGRVLCSADNEDGQAADKSTPKGLESASPRVAGTASRGCGNYGRAKERDEEREEHPSLEG